MVAVGGEGFEKWVSFLLPWTLARCCTSLYWYGPPNVHTSNAMPSVNTSDLRAALDPRSRTPLFAQLKDVLLHGLRSGMWSEDQPLPSERQLTSELGVSRAECREIFERVGTAVGRGIAHVMKIADIERVIIGGGVAEAGDVLIEPIRAAVRANTAVFGPVQPQIAVASIEQPGATGAALWARERHSQGD